MWGKGIASEALVGLIAYGVREHGIARMIATTAPENAASQRVLLKAGMRRGELRSHDDGGRTQVFEYDAPSPACRTAAHPSGSLP